MKKLFAIALILGCSNQHPELAYESPGRAPTPQSTNMIPGCRQTPETSHFALGQRLRDETDGDWSRVVGSYGVEASHRKTGFFQAIPNANSPAAARPPWATNGAAHNAKALEYFSSIGLPADQIAEVVSLATMGGSEGKVGLVAYTTSIKRRIDGVDVVGSFASVTINVDGDTVSEDIYWPEVRAESLAAVRHIQSGLATAEAHASFRAKLPDGYQTKPERIAIHHTPSVSATVYPDMAVITVDPDDAFALPKHFDLSGVEVQLPWEKRPSTPQPKR